MNRNFLCCTTAILMSGTVFAAEDAAFQLPVPESLLEHVLAYNGFSDAKSIYLPAEYGKCRTNKSSIVDGGLLGKAIQFEQKSIGWALYSTKFTLEKGGTVSVWFKNTKPFPADTNLNLLDINSLKNPGWVSMFLTDKISGLKNPGVFVQAYKLPGNKNFHTSTIKDFNAAKPAGEWHNVTISCNGKTVSWYLDGTLLKSLTLESGIPQNGEYNAIGFGRINTDPVLFDEFAVFDTALDETQIQEYLDFVKALATRANMTGESKQ